MLDIQPIRLLPNHHADIGATGQGCFMDVIAYLNGENQITDQSPCVCVTIRPIAIFLNDFADDEQRQRLLPFVLRAMGTATKDKGVVEARLTAVVRYAGASAAAAAKYAALYAAVYAGDAAAAANALCAAVYAAVYAAATNANANAANAANANANANTNTNAANAALYAANAASASAAAAAANANANANAAGPSTWDATREEIFQAGLDYLDEVCPAHAPAAPETIYRANKLTALNLG